MHFSATVSCVVLLLILIMTNATAYTVSQRSPTFTTRRRVCMLIPKIVCLPLYFFRIQGKSLCEHRFAVGTARPRQREIF